MTIGATPFFDELLNRGKTKVNVTDDEFNAALQDFNEQKEKINANAIVLITHDYQLQSEIQMYMRG